MLNILAGKALYKSSFWNVWNKKQKRAIDRSIEKLEKELSSIFDFQGIGCMEISLGMISRRRVASGYEWVIEI